MKWTNKETEFVRNNPDMSISEMARQLNRPYNTVYHNIAKHGLTAKPYRRFTQREELFIKDNYGKLAIVEIADTLNRSPKSVSQHVWVMKLKDVKEKSRRAVPVEVYYDIGWVERAKAQMERYVK